jgi:glycosyltransferase involved in cell wall biosynthesis
MRRLGIRNPLVLVACPAVCDVALKMKKSKLLYQRTDRFEESDGIDVETIKEYDQKLKKNADITYFVNRLLYAEESKQCKKAFFLDHGVDYEIFTSAEKNQETPHDIADIPKPIIGYFGEINAKAHSFDIVLAERIAELLPGMSFVYIGSATSDCTGLISKKNVWMLGKKEYWQIPCYGRCFDVAILPWVKNRWTEAANPIKVKEYLALGKPFVSTPVFTEIEKYLDVAYVAETPEEFTDCIKKALAEDCPERIAARRKKVQKDTWDSKAQLLLQEVLGENCIREVTR